MAARPLVEATKPPSSWPGIAVRRTASLPLAYARPSTSYFHGRQDVDARHKAGHDEDDGYVLAFGSLHRRVHPAAQEVADILALARPLHHEYREQVLLRIDPEEGAGHAAPEKLADRARERRDARVRAHGEAEAEPVPGREQRTLDLHGGIEVIGGHQFQRLAADDPDAAKHAAIEQHLREARVIHGGRHQAAAAGFHGRLLQHVEELHLVAGPGIVGKGLCEPTGIVLAGEEGRLGHLQRREDTFGQEGAERLAADDLDDAAEDVGGTAVVPFRAGLADQWQLRDHDRMLGIGDLAAAQLRFLVELLHHAVAGVVVGDAGGMAQQVLHRHRASYVDELEPAVGLDADLLPGEFRDEFRHGVTEQQMAFLDQRHDRDRDDRLCHREDPEDGVVGHWPSIRRALFADGVEPADLAPARNQYSRARKGPLVDFALEAIGQFLQSGRRQADRLRLGVRKWRGLRAGGLPGGNLCVHVSLPMALKGPLEVWRRRRGLNSAFRRFGLAKWAWPMLETARIARCFDPARSVAQLVEHRSPKPGVAGSSPATPASKALSS